MDNSADQKFSIDKDEYVQYTVTDDKDPSRPSEALAELNFFQHSELENDTYPVSPHGFPTQGISFLQESELGTYHQPHEDYTKGERAEEVDDLSESPRLLPIETLTEAQGPPKVNLGISTFSGAGTGGTGNAAAGNMLSSTQGGEKVHPSSDWAEEASPTTETAPAIPEKKKDDEWTTQGSRHSKYQSQQRGRGGGPRGGREGGGWRGSEGRGGSRGSYRGGRGGGERGASNGERRGSWRGGERGRRGGNNLPPTAV